MKNKNILLIVRSLYIYVGGVEKMSIEIANGLALKGYKISILTWDNHKDKKLPLDFHKIDKKIKVFQLNIGSIKNKSHFLIIIKRILKIRKIIFKQKINIIIAFVEGCYWNALLASMLTKIKVIASERTSPDRFKYISLKKYKFLIMNLFRFAYKITVQFPSYVEHYPNYLHKKIKVIPNSVSNIHLEKGLIDKKEKIILCVARSSFQKNIPCLLRSFSLIKNKKGWKLFIITSCEKENYIYKLINQLNIKTEVRIIKPLSDISNFYKKASIFCIPSYYEGFPNALAEAMIYGCACIGFKDCSGVNELIKNNKTGLLANGINNEKNLAEKLAILMKKKELRFKLGSNARKFIANYNKDEIIKKWEALLS